MSVVSKALRLLGAMVIGFIGHAISIGIANADEVNALSLQSGTILKSYTTQYGGHQSAEWVALSLIDGNPNIGWSSVQRVAAPNEFVFELATSYSLSSFSFDNTHTDEGTHPGISAKGIEIFISEQSADGPFQKVIVDEISPSAVSQIDLKKPVTARWVKLILSSNGGRADYTELMEFSAMGTPAVERQKNTDFSGIYDTNWGAFFLKYSNGELNGCYSHDNGKFFGKEVGGVMNIEWREDNDDNGTAVLALSTDGTQFNGYYYKNAALHGTWTGTRSDDQSSPPPRAASLIETTKTQVAQSLDTFGIAKLYGIYFDFDSDIIKPESARTLGDVYNWLSDNPEKKVHFEGHTDSKGGDDYNKTLSGKRAASVLTWLTGRGIDQNRLSSVGVGESQPVADNQTENGRGLNRRVEMKIRN